MINRPLCLARFAAQERVVTGAWIVCFVSPSFFFFFVILIGCLVGSNQILMGWMIDRSVCFKLSSKSGHLHGASIDVAENFVSLVSPTFAD